MSNVTNSAGRHNARVGVREHLERPFSLRELRASVLNAQTRTAERQAAQGRLTITRIVKGAQ